MRWGLTVVTCALAAVIVTIVALSTALDAGRLRAPFVRFLAAHMGRSIQIDGSLQTHFLSLNPSVIAERVSIGNPPWTPPGIAAQIERISLVLQLPGFGRSFAVRRFEMNGVILHLVRDSTGHANWQRTDPDQGPQSDLPIIRSLSMPRARVELDDDLRHLRFRGTVSAEDVNGIEASQPLRIGGSGELNGRAAEFEITGDALAAYSHEHPYGFNFSESSSGSHLTGSGSLVHPFDFDKIDAAFEAAGEDLRDLYFLTGVMLVNTGSYRLSGNVARRGTHSKFSNVEVTIGQSDVRADVSIDSSGRRPKFEAQLTSKILRFADLGARAAGREQDPEAGKLLLSDAMLNPGAVRHGDWSVHFGAQRIDVGHVSLHGVAAKMTIDQGVLVVSPLSADVLGGKLMSHVKFDARTDTAVADLDLKLTDVQVGQLGRKEAGSPPLEGSLQARLNLRGPGRSIHEVAAGADGTVTAVLTHGIIRSSLAELTGIDIRGLGLLLTKNKQETGIRCAVASFQAHDGTLLARKLVMDTDPVLITGEGSLKLDSESLDFALRGRPKSVRFFRLRAPVLVRGTLVRPAVSIETGKAVGQTAEAVALGVVLTPLAAVLAFVDPGLAKDVDCSSLEAQANAPVR
jgi:AsmA family protein